MEGPGPRSSRAVPSGLVVERSSVVMSLARGDARICRWWGNSDLDPSSPQGNASGCSSETLGSLIKIVPKPSVGGIIMRSSVPNHSSRNGWDFDGRSDDLERRHRNERLEDVEGAGYDEVGRRDDQRRPQEESDPKLHTPGLAVVFQQAVDDTLPAALGAHQGVG